MARGSHARSAARRPSVATAPEKQQKAPGKALPSEFGATAVSDLPIWYQFVQFGGQIGPSAITTAISLADIGNITQLVDLVHEFRQKDLHFHACATTFENDISGLNWQAMPYGGKNARKSDAKLARILEAVVDECRGFSNMLCHEAGEGELFGHATSEAMWGWYAGASSLLKGWFVQQQLNPISCRRFGFRTADGKLLFDAQNTGNVDTGGVDLLEKFAAGKFLQHRVRVNGDVPVREGIGRGIVWPCAFRNWDIRDWLLEAEQSWKPLKIATVKKTGGSVDKDDAAAAHTIIQRLVTAGGVVKPDTIDLVIEWAKNAMGAGQSKHRELAEFLGQEISKGLLGHTQIVEVGTKGARSASEVGYTVSKDRIKPRALGLAATIHLHFTIPLFAYNAPGKRPPILLPDLGEPINMKEFAQMLKDLKGPQGAALATPARWAREQIGMPTPEPGEEMVGGGVWVDPKEQAELDAQAAEAAAEQAAQDAEQNQDESNQNDDEQDGNAEQPDANADE